MSAPKWAVGMRVLAPGVYADAKDTLHIDPYAICLHLRVPYTGENEEIIKGIVAKAFRERFGVEPNLEIVEEK